MDKNEIELLKRELGTSVLTAFGSRGGGCINEGQGFTTNTGRIYIKKNKNQGSKLMFDGEYESLAKIYATSTVKVPKPIKIIENPKGGAFLAMEYFEMKGGLRKYEAELGKKVAELHKCNSIMLKEKERQASFVHKEKDGFRVEPINKFGFSVPTSATPNFVTTNEWYDDWVQFYARQKLQPLISKINEKRSSRELSELWNQLQRRLPNFFAHCPKIVPSLLHGDMWNGNVDELADEPVLFDPMSFYGHSEFEFGIAEMFGGFSDTFYKAYHQIMPKTNGFEERNDLYQLFHHLNHWFIFGDSYKFSSLKLMRSLCQ